MPIKFHFLAHWLFGGEVKMRFRMPWFSSNSEYEVPQNDIGHGNNANEL